MFTFIFFYLLICFLIAYIHEQVEAHNFWTELGLCILLTPIAGIISLWITIARKLDSR